MKAPLRLLEFGELERYRLAMIAANEAVYDWTPVDDRVQWSDNAADVLGINDLEEVSTSAGFNRHLMPQGVAARREAIAQVENTGASFRTEYQFLAADGHPIWLEDRGLCLYDGDGYLVRMVGILRVITERKTQEARLSYLASFDELTGHLNRTRLREKLGQAIAHAERSGKSASYMVIGIDNLAVINETYGFDVADEVIVAVGEALGEGLAPADAMGRTAGNKFGILLQECGASKARRIAEKLLRHVRDLTIHTRAGRVTVTVSIGCVTAPQYAKNSQEAMSRAEHALDQAKRNGRDNYCGYQPSPEKDSIRKRNVELADEIITALNDGRVVLAYQPIVCVHTRDVVQYECLMRMQRKDGTIMSAGAFVPVAEQLGLIRLLDRHVMRMALETLRAGPDLHMALNLSGLTTGDGSWLDALIESIDGDADLARRLTVELTETLAIEDIEQTRRFVESLQEIGCRVAIDDFGAGYTTFRNLQRLHVDSVKIDGSFVRGLAENRDNQIFVRTLVELARNFGVSTVAEWVSSDEEVALLRNLGVDYVQGFHVGEPQLTVPAR